MDYDQDHDSDQNTFFKKIHISGKKKIQQEKIESRRNKHFKSKNINTLCVFFFLHGLYMRNKMIFFLCEIINGMR